MAPFFLIVACHRPGTADGSIAVTLIVRNGHIEQVCYPVFLPDKYADEVIAWLKKHPITA
jgi:peroxiredoxin